MSQYSNFMQQIFFIIATEGHGTTQTCREISQNSIVADNTPNKQRNNVHCSSHDYNQWRGEALKENNPTQCAVANVISNGGAKRQKLNNPAQCAVEMVTSKDGAKPQKEYSPG